MTDGGPSEGERVDRYETILKNIHDGVYTLDANGRITWVNQTAVEDFDVGYTRDELVGAPVSKVLNREDIEKARTIIRTLLEDEDRESGRCEVAIRTVHGTEIPCDLHLSLLPIDKGEFQGTVGVLRDITDQKQREQRLAVLNRVLRHNVRNDMTLILGSAEHLQQNLDGPDAEKATLIRTQAEGLLGLAEKARRIEETLEGHDHGRTAIDVVEVVRDRVSAFRERHPDATFRIDAPEKQWALANETLEIAIDELLKNAIEHNDGPDGIVVAISIRDQRDTISIRVEDNGPSIPEEEIAVLEVGHETPLQHASGLGLWLVHWFVNSCGGGLSFEPSATGGNAVTIKLQPVSTSNGR